MIFSLIHTLVLKVRLNMKSDQYWEYSSLNKLMKQYEWLMKKKLYEIETQTVFMMFSWWKSFITIIKQDTNSITVKHNYILRHRNVLIIYTDDSSINSKIETSVISLFVSEKKTAYFKKKNVYTVYFVKLYEIKITLKIIKKHQNNWTLIIFTDSQIIIRSMLKLRKQFKQYFLHEIMNMMMRQMKLHWISVYTEVSVNKLINIAANV